MVFFVFDFLSDFLKYFFDDNVTVAAPRPLSMELKPLSISVSLMELN